MEVVPSALRLPSESLNRNTMLSMSYLEDGLLWWYRSNLKLDVSVDTDKSIVNELLSIVQVETLIEPLWDY